MQHSTEIHPTTSSTHSAGNKIGSKIGGVFETVHGAGEALRGNAMSFLDEATGTRRGRTQNEQVAEQGRLEVREGMERMGARTGVGASAPVTSTSATTGLHTGGGGVGTTGHPVHHRDDAISGLPSRERYELGREAELSAAGASGNAPYRRHEYN